MMRAALRGAALALSLALLAVPAQAGSALESALASGSPRLALFSLLANPATARSRLTASLLRAQGFTRAEGWQRSARLAPVLYWDDNINGGVPTDQVSIGGGIWTVDEDSRAKRGVVLGAELSGNQSRRLGFGRRLVARQALRLSYAPAHDITLKEARLSLCSLNYLDRWTFLDLCLGQRWSARDAEHWRETWGQASLSKLLLLGRTPSELSLSLRHGQREDYAQSMVTLSGTFAFAGLGAVGAAWSLGSVPEGHAVVSRAARLSLSRPLLGKTTSLALGWQREEGGSYLGAPREDQVWTLSVTRPVSAKVTAELGLRRRDSSAEPYAGTGVFVNFRLGGLSLD